MKGKGGNATERMAGLRVMQKSMILFVCKVQVCDKISVVNSCCCGEICNIINFKI